MFEDPVHDQRRRRQRARPAFRHTRRRRQFRRGNPRDRSREFARLDCAERIAVHDLDRRAGRFDVRFRERPPAAAHRIEHRARQRAGQAALQDLVDLPLRRRESLRQHRLDRQGAERQADPAVPHMIVDRLRDFETAAAHIADRPDRPEEPRDDAKRSEARLFGAAEDTDVQAGLSGDGGGELRPVRSAPHRLGRHGVDSGYAHGLGDGAKPPRGLDGPAKAVGRDGARFGEPFRQAAQRFLVEARHRRPTKLIVDHKPDRVRADVDDRIGRPFVPLGALEIEVERPRRLIRALGASLGHRASSPRPPYHAGRGTASQGGATAGRTRGGARRGAPGASPFRAIPIGCGAISESTVTPNPASSWGSGGGCAFSAPTQSLQYVGRLIPPSVRRSTFRRQVRLNNSLYWLYYSSGATPLECGARADSRGRFVTGASSTCA